MTKDAFSAASATEVTNTEYVSDRYFARSGSFSATTRSLTCLPARRSPASSASPILPPPMIAILATVKALQTAATARYSTPGASRTGRHHGELATLHHDAALAVDDDVVFVEPVLADLGRGAQTRSQPSAGSARRYAVSCTVGAQPMRFTANVTGADTSPHSSANSTSGATPFGRTQYSIDGRRRPSARGANVVSDGRMSQPASQVDDVGHRVPRPDRLEAGRRLRRHQRHHRVDRQQRRDVMFRVSRASPRRGRPCGRPASTRRRSG